MQHFLFETMNSVKFALSENYSNRTLLTITITIFVLGIIYSLTRPEVYWINSAGCRYHVAHDLPYGRKNWFDEILPEPSVVKKWNNAQMDEKFHKLSHWTSFNSSQWLEWVDKSLHALEPPLEKNKHFTFLEIGSGVGAFARVILSKYPKSRGAGVDLSQRAVNIANCVLPEDRMRSYVADARDMDMIPNFAFDYVIIPGVLCYLSNLYNVKLALLEMLTKVKNEASIAITMLPLENMGSCNVKIEPDFWTSPTMRGLGLKLLKLDYCHNCGLSHAEGRYAVFLQVNRSQESFQVPSIIDGLN
jgi:SAM-dependent methyltransferase